MEWATDVEIVSLWLKSSGTSQIPDQLLIIHFWKYQQEVSPLQLFVVHLYSIWILDQNLPQNCLGASKVRTSGRGGALYLGPAPPGSEWHYNVIKLNGTFLLSSFEVSYVSGVKLLAKSGGSCPELSTGEKQK